MVSWNETGMCLAAQAEALSDTGSLALPVHLRKSEDILYIDILTEKEGVRI